MSPPRTVFHRTRLFLCAETIFEKIRRFVSIPVDRSTDSCHIGTRQTQTHANTHERRNEMIIENTLPVNFHRMYLDELREFFDTIPTKEQVIEVVFNYEGTNWVIPHAAGKRLAGIELGLSWRELETKCGR